MGFVVETFGITSPVRGLTSHRRDYLSEMGRELFGKIIEGSNRCFEGWAITLITKSPATARAR